MMAQIVPPEFLHLGASQEFLPGGGKAGVNVEHTFTGRSLLLPLLQRVQGIGGQVDVPGLFVLCAGSQRIQELRGLSRSQTCRIGPILKKLLDLNTIWQECE